MAINEIETETKTQNEVGGGGGGVKYRGTTISTTNNTRFHAVFGKQ